ncbi:MAG: phosphoribosylanthranilate isomerase [Phycisphaeraceae bacterium]
MSRTRIKICGVRDVETALAAADAGADAVGLVFVHGSPRHIEVAAAKPIVDALPPFVEPVGLFVDATVDVVRDTARELGLRTVQLHGHETTHYVASLAPLRVIKSVAVAGDQSVGRLEDWRESCPNLAALLFDAPPGPTGMTGGGGKPFDWNALGRLKREGVLDRLPPYLLSGGLDAGNVRQAIALLWPYGVDVSSGVESTRGVKDIAKIREFCDAVRHAPIA